MKFSGMIGFWIEDVEVKPGVYRPKIVEKRYTGDIHRNFRNFQSDQSHQNENLQISNKISILSNLYIQNNYSSVKYIICNGVKWSVKSVDLSSYPRIIFELGGIYNGETISS